MARQFATQTVSKDGGKTRRTIKNDPDMIKAFENRGYKIVAPATAPQPVEAKSFEQAEETAPKKTRKKAAENVDSEE